MSASQVQCTAEEQRAVILFLVGKGVLGAEIHRRFLPQHGDSALQKAVCVNRLKSFKVAGQASSIHKEQKAHQAPPLTTIANKLNK